MAKEKQLQNTTSGVTPDGGSRSNGPVTQGQATPPKDTSNSSAVVDKGLGAGKQGTGGTLEDLKKDLGTAKDVPSATNAMGKALDSVDVGDDQSIGGELSVEIDLAGAELEFGIEFSLARSSGDLTFSCSFLLSAGREVDLGFVEVEGGLYVAGSVEVKADSGVEVMRLLALAMLPHLRGKSARLADALYDGSAAFEKEVLDEMDADDPANATDDDEADTVTSSLEAGAYIGAEVDFGEDTEAGADLKLGYRSETTLSKNGEGKLTRQKTEGLNLSLQLEVGGLSWSIAYFDGTFEITASAEAPAGTNAVLAQYLVGVVQSIPLLVTLIRAQTGKKQKSADAQRGLDAAWGLLEKKMTSVTTSVIEAQLPGTTAAEVGFELILAEKGSSFAITASQVVEREAGGGTSAAGAEVKGKLSSSQTLLRIQ